MTTAALIPVYHKLGTDFRTFARNAVCIEGNEPGKVFWGLACAERPEGAEHWEFNTAQEYLDYHVNKMLAEMGWVRLIIVKGRQQGISTYVEMRLEWLALFNPNTKVCIISHEQDSAISLFRKATFMHSRLPQEIKPTLGTSNRKEMKFGNDSNYLVLTAGSEESGRSQTAHHQHQSERGFFKNAEAIDAGAGQIVALKPRTEVYKESTGNGMNHFYQEVLDALAGKGVYRVIFIPWYWEIGYQTRVRPGFKRTLEEEQLMATSIKNPFTGAPGLYCDEQLQWRRDKIVELKTLRKFRQEYPHHLMEAFQASGETFFDSDLVHKAMQSKVKATFGPLIMGVDAGREGDRTVITFRRGCEVQEIIKYDTMNQMRLAGLVSGFIDKRGVDKCFIDWGMGHGTIDRLRERGYGDVVEGVNFGGSADDPIYLNKRAEMAFMFRDWLNDGDVSLPDDKDIAADIASMPSEETSSSGKIKFPSKAEIKKDYGRSPDILDSIMLTFAYPVRTSKYVQELRDQSRQEPKPTLRTQARRYEGEPSSVTTRTSGSDSGSGGITLRGLRISNGSQNSE